MRMLPAAVALFLSAPALAQGPGAYDQGVAARRAGDPAKAAGLFEEALRAEPDNSDALVQYGYALLALGRLDEARQAFDRALVIAPGYQDARDGLALVERRRGAPTTKFQFDLDGSASSIRGQRDWREVDAQLSYRPHDRLTASGRVEVARRFGLTDTYGEARIDLHPDDPARVYLLAGATPHADFRPELQLGAGGAYRLTGSADPTVATVDVRWARYASGVIWTVNPGVQQYLAGGKLWLTAQWINVIDQGHRAGGWLGRADVQASPRLRLFAGAADAPDTSEGVAIDTFSLFGGASVNLSDRLALRLSIAHDKPELGARRTTFSLGTGIRF